MKPRKTNNPSSPDKQKSNLCICMEQKHGHAVDVHHASLFKPKPNLIKRKKRFESMRKLLDTNKSPWSHQFSADQEVVSQQLKKPSWKEKRKSGDLYAKVEVVSSVMERAQAVQANLDAHFPSFIKPMIKSNVTRGFWLSLPNLFCKLHLPRHDTTITLMDESQRIYNTRYLAERNGLSAGWRGFSIAHDLVEGDVLVFHLVGAYRMKVYIVRANHLEDVDAALNLLHLDARARHIDSAEEPIEDNKPIKEPSEPCLSPCLPEVPSDRQLLVNDNVYEDLSLPLEGLITETLSIADAVKENKIAVSPNDFTEWKKRLTCFEKLHDSLGWIQARLDHLVCCILESNEGECRKRSRQAGYNCHQGGDELRTFKVKMLELKEATEKLNAEIEVLKLNADVHKIPF